MSGTSISLPAAHFRTGLEALTIASLGLGTYLGEPDDATDAAYAETLAAALRLGTNLVDTAANYRAQRSERVIGRTLAALVAAGELGRDEVVVCTKGGYLPFDGSYPADPRRWLHDTYVASGLLAPDEITGAGTRSPRATSATRSGRAAGTSRSTRSTSSICTIPRASSRRSAESEVMARIGRAFRVLEEAVDAGAIAAYGLATWNGFRVAPTAREYLALADLVALAEREVGPDHHFRAVQLPCNLAMTEAVTARHQPVGTHVGSLVEAADHHGIMVVASASLLQGSSRARFPPSWPKRWQAARPTRSVRSSSCARRRASRARSSACVDARTSTRTWRSRGSHRPATTPTSASSTQVAEKGRSASLLSRSLVRRSSATPPRSLLRASHLDLLSNLRGCLVRVERASLRSALSFHIL